ncbi:MAG: DNA-processing protein DprA [Clostridia bacterium]|nr:DNA-processing protein DprA [Clostridia bacterium]
MRYTREDGCRAWLTYGLLRADAAMSLLNEFGCAEAIYDRFVKEGSTFLQKRISESSITLLRDQSAPEKMHDMMVTMQKLSIGIISHDDARYPDSLRDLRSPPALLFYRGNPDCLMGKCITVIGSRKASPQAMDATMKICRELSDAGVTIVSGLAMGIDTAAHEGCLQGKSPTAAILGCGMDVDYPMENVDLKENIVQRGGMLLSEYPLGLHASPHVFQVRNRILAGLSRAILMMESRIRSGSMLTVQHALDHGKEVYAYPGQPGTDWAEGAHQLLREGANYFTSARDVLEDLNWLDDEPTPSVVLRQELPEMTEEQRRVYTLLGQGEMSYDQLAAKSGIPAPALSVALTMLQMMGLIKPMPGKSYCKA